MRQVLQSVTEVYYKVRQVLQSVTGCYYKVRQVLQSVQLLQSKTEHMHEIDNITLKFFVMRKYMIIIIDHHKVWIFLKLREKKQRADKLHFNFLLSLNMLKSLFG